MAGMNPAHHDGTDRRLRNEFGSLHSEPRSLQSQSDAADNFASLLFFIIFVDAIFTTLFERLFTNDFDVTHENPAFACVYRACNAD